MVNLNNRECIENFQNICHINLKEKLSTLKDNSRGLKFGKILLSLKSVTRNLNSKLIEKLFFKRISQKVSIDTYIKETVLQKYNSINDSSRDTNTNNKRTNDQLNTYHMNTIYNQRIMNAYANINNSNFSNSFKNEGHNLLKLPFLSDYPFGNFGMIKKDSLLSLTSSYLLPLTNNNTQLN